VVSEFGFIRDSPDDLLSLRNLLPLGIFDKRDLLRLVAGKRHGMPGAAAAIDNDECNHQALDLFTASSLRVQNWCRIFCFTTQREF